MKCASAPTGSGYSISDNSAAHVWEVPEFRGAPPAWLAGAANALAARGIPGEARDVRDAFAEFARAKAQAEADPGEGAYARLAGRLFSTQRNDSSAPK